MSNPMSGMANAISTNPATSVTRRIVRSLRNQARRNETRRGKTIRLVRVMNADSDQRVEAKAILG
jgi:hypothetical protein